MSLNQSSKVSEGDLAWYRSSLIYDQLKRSFAQMTAEILNPNSFGGSKIQKLSNYVPYEGI